MIEARVRDMLRGTGIGDRARRKWAQMRYRYQANHHTPALGIERVGGLDLAVIPNVFNPTLFFSTEFFIGALSSLPLPDVDTVLEVGCGSGAVSCWFAVHHANAHIECVDINPDAVRCTNANALLHGLQDRVFAKEGDLFNDLKGRRFDLVLCNPPYFDGTPVSLLDHAFFSNEVSARFAAGLSEHLTPRGRALIVLSSMGNSADFLASLRSHGLTARSVSAVQDGPEHFDLYEVQAC